MKSPLTPARVTAVMLAVVLFPAAACATWQADGTPIYTTGSWATEPCLVEDGYGGAIVAWDASWEVRAQRFNSNGSLLWGSDWVCGSGSGWIEGPRIATDGDGGALVSYSRVNGPYCMDPPECTMWWWENYCFAERVGPDGGSVWSYPTQLWYDQSYDPLSPTEIVTDDAGGAIGARCYGNVHAERVNASGTVVWDYKLLGSGDSSPDLAPDGAGGAIAVWPYYQDIYARRVSAAGTVLWTSGGVPICTATGNQTGARLVPDGASGAIIAWADYRNGNWDIYAQRVNSSGVVQWTANGNAICTETGAQSGPWLVSDGAGGAIIVWQDARSGNSDVYAQRVDASGSALWTAGGVAVCTESGDQTNLRAIADGAGGTIITWQDARSGSSDVYAQRVDAGGSALWTAGGVAVCTAAANQANPALVSDGSGGTLIAWEDYRAGNWDIYAQRVLSDGSIPLPSDETPPVVTVVRPNGGETLYTGTQDTIRWVATDDSGVDSVSLYYSTDGGATFPYLIAGGEPNDSVYVWTVPATVSSDCRVKVVAYDPSLNEGSDTSDADFAIAARPVPALSRPGALALLLAAAGTAVVLLRRRQRV